jgi:hypothetical protein
LSEDKAQEEGEREEEEKEDENEKETEDEEGPGKEEGEDLHISNAAGGILNVGRHHFAHVYRALL